MAEVDAHTLPELAIIQKHHGQHPPTHLLLAALIQGLGGGKKKSLIEDSAKAKKLIDRPMTLAPSIINQLPLEYRDLLAKAGQPRAAPKPEAKMVRDGPQGPIRDLNDVLAGTATPAAPASTPAPASPSGPQPLDNFLQGFDDSSGSGSGSS